jgi:single-strand DNA-binding protein
VRAERSINIVATLNQCSFIGHFGKDPVLEVTGDGTPFTKFSLAVDQGKDKQGTDKKPMWLNITCWGELAEIVERYGHKGAQVFVQGRLQITTYEDKTTKAKRQSIDIVATIVQLLDKKAENADEQETLL